MNAYNDPLFAATVSPLSVGDSTVMKAIAITETCVVRADDEANMTRFVLSGCRDESGMAATHCSEIMLQLTMKV